MSEQLQNRALDVIELEGSELSSLLQKEFKPKTDEARSEVESAVLTLAQQALEGVDLVGDDVVDSIERMIAAIDQKLSVQINEIIHHADFQQMESAWRGLNYLVNNTETDEFLKIRFMNVSKTELAKTLKRYKGVAWDQSPVFKKIYEHEYGQFGGEPYGCLIGDYYFDHSPPDVEMLGELSKISASAHAPFLSAVSPATLQMDSWQELANPRDLTKIFSTPD
ncbi:MAG TPA: type VI secretion system contractile sheath large subunit, partial [Limnobacter sp.]|nr:type VI secretion system contractile sheath large subunit [Limnobacter sp.]